MAAPGVNVDHVPQAARPAAVAAALTEALELRDRLRQAQEEVAAAQAELERQQADDVARAAERVRAGSPLGNMPAAVTKAREAVELKKRNAAAISAACDGTLTDLAAALAASADDWAETLDHEADDARARAGDALTAFEAALADLSAATSARAWLGSGRADGRWDRRPAATTAGSRAPSSARAAANGEAFDRAAILRYARELVEAPAPRAMVAEPAAT